jgi:HAD superfamily hydrolase (TIGR01484 family)
MGETTPRLVATDLDGTIVRSDGAISDRMVDAVRLARRRGAEVIFLTGRPPRLMGDIGEAFGREGIAVCSNGAFVYDLRSGVVVEENAIEPAVLAEAAKLLRAAVPEIGLAIEYADGVAGDHRYEAGDWDAGIVIERLHDDELFARPAPKLVGRHPTLSADELLALAAPALSPIVMPYHANGVRLVEAVAIGVNKASALATLAGRHGIDPADAIAFGDMPNDLLLLEWAGTSYAVANAHPDVLRMVDHVIGSNDDDGVAEVLERLFA